MHFFSFYPFRIFKYFSLLFCCMLITACAKQTPVQYDDSVVESDILHDDSTAASSNESSIQDASSIEKPKSLLTFYQFERTQYGDEPYEAICFNGDNIDEDVVFEQTGSDSVRQILSYEGTQEVTLDIRFFVYDTDVLTYTEASTGRGGIEDIAFSCAYSDILKERFTAQNCCLSEVKSSDTSVMAFCSYQQNDITFNRAYLFTVTDREYQGHPVYEEDVLEWTASSDSSSSLYVQAYLEAHDLFLDDFHLSPIGDGTLALFHYYAGQVNDEQGNPFLPKEGNIFVSNVFEETEHVLNSPCPDCAVAYTFIVNGSFHDTDNTMHTHISSDMIPDILKNALHDTNDLNIPFFSYLQCNIQESVEFSEIEPCENGFYKDIYYADADAHIRIARLYMYYINEGCILCALAYQEDYSNLPNTNYQNLCQALDTLCPIE